MAGRGVEHTIIFKHYAVGEPKTTPAEVSMNLRVNHARLISVRPAVRARKVHTKLHVAEPRGVFAILAVLNSAEDLSRDMVCTERYAVLRVYSTMDNKRSMEKLGVRLNWSLGLDERLR